MAEFVEEDELNFALIMEKGFHNLGDEDFAVFKCPVCKRIYLIEYECDTIFSDPNDPSVCLAILSTCPFFSCLSCEYPFREGIIGPKADNRYRVTKDELLASNWSWLLLRGSQQELLQKNLHICFSAAQFRFRQTDPALAERMSKRTTTLGDLIRIREELFRMHLDPACASYKQGFKEAYDWLADQISAAAADPPEVRMTLAKMWKVETRKPDKE